MKSRSLSNSNRKSYERPVNLASDTGFGASERNSSWLRLNPIPATDDSRYCPEELFSIRMPIETIKKAEDRQEFKDTMEKIGEPIAASNNGSVETVMYCAERLDTKVKFTKEACEMYTKIPRPFMKAALTQIAQIAEQNGITVIDKAAAIKIGEIKKKMK